MKHAHDVVKEIDANFSQMRCVTGSNVKITEPVWMHLSKVEHDTVVQLKCKDLGS